MIDWTNLDDGTEPIYRAELSTYAEEKAMLNNLINLCYSTGRIDSAVRAQLLLMVSERNYLTAYQMMSLIDGIMTRTGMIDEYKELSEEAIEYIKGWVFAAEYGTTTFEEIKEASGNNKIVILKYDNVIYYLGELLDSAAYFYQTIEDTHFTVSVTSADVWTTAETEVVPATRTVNGKALSSDITLSASDVSAVPTTRTVNGKALSSNITLSASDVSAVPTTRTVNGKALSSNITLSASDVSAVPTTRTVNSKALSSDITLTASDVNAMSLTQELGTYTFTTVTSYLNAGVVTYTRVGSIVTLSWAIKPIATNVFNNTFVTVGTLTPESILPATAVTDIIESTSANVMLIRLKPDGEIQLQASGSTAAVYYDGLMTYLITT